MLYTENVLNFNRCRLGAFQSDKSALLVNFISSSIGLKNTIFIQIHEYVFYM